MDKDLIKDLSDDGDQARGYEVKCIAMRLFSVMSSLDPRGAECVRLSYFEDKSNREIARLLGVSEARISQLIQRAVLTMHELCVT